MAILNSSELTKAAKKNAPLRKALDQWLQVTEAATWASIQEVRSTFPAADGVTISTTGGIGVVATVFNIKGNQFRLITIINYPAATVLVREVLTHAEYSKGLWKDRI